MTLCSLIRSRSLFFFSCFFFNDTATTEIYTLSLHDALPISSSSAWRRCWRRCSPAPRARPRPRSEEHTSELQSHVNLVCRLLLEKKKHNKNPYTLPHLPLSIQNHVSSYTSSVLRATWPVRS